jgi:hypothetical protein
LRVNTTYAYSTYIHRDGHTWLVRVVFGYKWLVRVVIGYKWLLRVVVFSYKWLVRVVIGYKWLLRVVFGFGVSCGTDPFSSQFIVWIGFMYYKVVLKKKKYI